MARKIRQVKFAGGVNRFGDPRVIGEDEVVSARNLAPDGPGKLTKRRGSTLLPTSLIAYWDIYPVVKVYPTNEPTPRYVTIQNTGGTFYDVLFGEAGMTPPAGTRPRFINRSTGQYSGRPQIIQLANKIYIFGGDAITAVDGTPPYYPGLVQSLASGAPYLQPFVFWDAGNDYLRPRLAAVYRQRVVYADLAVGHEDELIFSDRFRPDIIGVGALTSNGRAFTVGSRADGAIVALLEVMQTSVGSPSQSALLVMRERASYLITGEPTETTDTSSDNFIASLTINRMSVDAGCASAETIVNTPYGMVWASYDDVWVMPEGQLPRPVGAKIRDRLQRAPKSSYKWHAVYHNGYYRLAIGTDADGVNPLLFTDTDAAMNEQWWLEMATGAPSNHNNAKWWGPQVYNNLVGKLGTRNMYTEMTATGRRLMTSDRRFSGPSGEVQQIQLESDIPDDLQSGISTQLISRVFDDGDPMVDKVPQNLELRYTAGEDVGIVVEVRFDGRSTATWNGTAIAPANVAASGIEQDSLSIYPTDIFAQARGQAYQIVLSDPDSATVSSGAASLKITDINLIYSTFFRRP